MSVSTQQQKFRYELLDTQLTKWFHILEVFANFMQVIIVCPPSVLTLFVESPTMLLRLQRRQVRRWEPRDVYTRVWPT